MLLFEYDKNVFLIRDIFICCVFDLKIEIKIKYYWIVKFMFIYCDWVCMCLSLKVLVFDMYCFLI